MFSGVGSHRRFEPEEREKIPKFLLLIRLPQPPPLPPMCEPNTTRAVAERLLLLMYIQAGPEMPFWRTVSYKLQHASRATPVHGPTIQTRPARQTGSLCRGSRRSRAAECSLELEARPEGESRDY